MRLEAAPAGTRCLREPGQSMRVGIGRRVHADPQHAAERAATGQPQRGRRTAGDPPTQPLRPSIRIIVVAEEAERDVPARTRRPAHRRVGQACGQVVQRGRRWHQRGEQPGHRL